MARKNHAFKIVALGEDFAAVMRAQELSRRLTAELEPEFEIRSEAWKFEALDDLPLRREAARGLANADMIIIAASGMSELPAQVKKWVENWLPQKRKGPTALVALSDHEDETSREPSLLCTYLRRMARKWGMDFFSNSADWWKQLESTPTTPA